MRPWIVFALLPIALCADPHTHRPLAYNPDQINSPTQPDIAEGARGSAVLRAQILLDRAHFSCGQLDGDFGANLKKTVAAYQQDRRLDPTGAVNPATWASLNLDTAPALTTYTVSPEDEQGPFVVVPTDVMKQAALPYLGYASPADELGERFHANPELLKALNRGADFTAPGQQLTVPNVVTMPPSGIVGRVEVSKTESSVRVYDRQGALLAFYIATIGSTHDPLPLGNWRVTTVEHNPTFHYDARLFWDAPNPDDRATIKPGPRNPVGVAKIGISKPHYGIHGTPDASKIGHTFSHGCIRLANWDAWELSSMVKRSLPVILKE